ncbi:MAG: C1 family peptidase [Nanoarchaeota archaeon]|nr:DUF333 domain-containing protein [Nanoarchaeota archaeon]MBU1445398.1 DUF333 domain-containing protein [Nanoarchaeota archaeon]MBU2406538.1 DUF333 domain-containing protein [Nanoarchaeota archaeon]MBU2420171.1 DUF333 domain-containing protein [Nanoarchaeota archaeon]MBU2475254.1 DUF333 domain-containing protein [Nanoarchaeota archaeon]
MKWFIILLIFVLLISLVPTSQGLVPSSQEITEEASTCGGDAPGMSNPAAVYCIELGYSYDNGFCVFNKNERCEEWAFLQGKCGQKYSVCSTLGLKTKIKTDGQNPFTQEYVVCTSGRKEVASATDMINLSEKSTKGFQEIVEKETTKRKVEKKIALPFEFDWRNHRGEDWTTSVKNQGTCGSCWAFATVGIVESAYNIYNNNPDLDLAEEYLVSDCHLQYGWQTCCGGFQQYALDFIQSEGIPDEECMNYVSGSGCYCISGACNANCEYSSTLPRTCADTTCDDRCEDWDERLYDINDATYFNMNSSLSKDEIKQFIIEKGPVASNMLFGYGYWDGDVYKCESASHVNHAVILVGYNDIDNYWIVKNSYGAGFGDEGYFKVAYGNCFIDTPAWLSYVEL